MDFWLLKTEPTHYSYDDLLAAGEDTWEGVKNATAQIHLRAMTVGDRCAMYHSGQERRVVGWAIVSRAAYPDPEDPTGRRVAVDVRATEPLARPVTLAQLREEPEFQESPLLRISRLSVVPLTETQAEIIRRLSDAAK